MVAFSESRSREEMERNSLIKDSMRGIGKAASSAAASESVAAELVNSIVGLVRSPPPASDPDLPALALDTLKLFMNWVDVSLIMTPLVLSTLFSSLAHPPLSASAADCVLELVNKGMDENLKLSLLQELNLIEKLSPVLPTAPETLACKISEIVNAVGIQLLAVHDKSDLGGPQDPSAEATLAVSSSLLNQLMPLFTKSLSNPLSDVAAQVFPLVSRFTVTLGRQVPPLSSPPPPAPPFPTASYLPTVLHSLYTQSMYPYVQPWPAARATLR